jgi:hypothetical protein
MPACSGSPIVTERGRQRRECPRRKRRFHPGRSKPTSCRLPRFFRAPGYEAALQALDLRTAAERTLKHFEQRFERTAGEVTRFEVQHLSARTDVLYLGLAFVLPEWYRILLFALGAGDLEGVRSHLTARACIMVSTLIRVSRGIVARSAGLGPALGWIYP